MRRQLSFIVASILGSFCVYCAQDGMSRTGGLFDAGVVADGAARPADGGGGGGFVPDARAQAGAAFTVLAEGDLDIYAKRESDPIAVGSYSEVVVYSSSEYCTLGMIFRATASAKFGYTGQLPKAGGRVRIDGSDLKVSLESCDSGSTTHWVVAGAR
jgi:hypothetical protein